MIDIESGIRKITSGKAFKIGVLVFIVLLLAASVRLFIFLWNVNRDMDTYYYQITALQKEVARLETIQSTMVTKAEAQRILDEQTAYYQSQLDELAGEVNGAYYQMSVNQQQAQDRYNLRQMESGIKYSR
jgi:Tfp pilus assembly protein PilN